MIAAASLTVAFLLAQDPAAAAAVAGPDLVVLASGEELWGKVVIDNASYVEIRLGRDATLGFERAGVREVRIGAAEPAAAAEPGALPDAEVVPLVPPAAAAAEPALFAESDRWYLLHDGSGVAVGTLHTSVTRRDDGNLRLAEEWSFTDDRLTTEVTRMEVASPAGVPRSCFFHERSRLGGDDAVHDERLVRGELADGELVVVCTDRHGSRRHTYRVGPGATFALVLQEMLRQRPAALAFRGERIVYDCARDELAEWRYATGVRRRVELDGQTIEVREAHHTVGGRRNSEWIDATCRPVRREINGPALVAVRSGRDMAMSAAAAGVAVFPQALLGEPDGRYAVWLPNPVWRFDAEQEPGRISASAPLAGGSLSVMLLDHIPPHLALDSAADAVERWLALATDSFEPRSRTMTAVRGSPAVRLRGVYLRDADDRRIRYATDVCVLRTPAGAWLAVCFAAPAAAFEELAADFDDILRSLELRPIGPSAELAAGDAAARLPRPAKRR